MKVSRVEIVGMVMIFFWLVGGGGSWCCVNCKVKVWLVEGEDIDGFFVWCNRGMFLFVGIDLLLFNYWLVFVGIVLFWLYVFVRLYWILLDWWWCVLVLVFGDRFVLISLVVVWWFVVVGLLLYCVGSVGWFCYFLAGCWVCFGVGVVV